MLLQILKLHCIFLISSIYSGIKLTHPKDFPWFIITEWYPIPYQLSWVDLENYSKYNVKEFKQKEDWFLCANCNDFLKQSYMRELDWCMCSLECGLHYRGMSYYDFL